METRHVIVIRAVVAFYNGDHSANLASGLINLFAKRNYAKVCVAIDTWLQRSSDCCTEKLDVSKRVRLES